jgi:uncharacterized protein YcfJ
VKNALVISLLAVPLLGGCATDPYSGRPNTGSRIAGGAVVGAVVGGVAGQAIGGNPIVGAAAGMVAGGAIGAATTAGGAPHRRYYRDTRGYCYYVDESGQARYDRNVSC